LVTDGLIDVFVAAGGGFMATSSFGSSVMVVSFSRSIAL
jgi:hypothetical protein